MKKKFPIYVYLDRIRSLYNVGSFFRTCDATHVMKLFLSSYTPVPPRKEITKTALGAEHTVPFESVTDGIRTLQDLQKTGVMLVAVEIGKNTIPYTDFHPTYPVCLIFGNEVTGIAEDILRICDAIISIPMYGTKGSLNVVVSGGIILYDVVQKYLNKTSSLL
jgi:tRNA G18 (ribose-2'-O)-methylase SpoU